MLVTLLVLTLGYPSEWVSRGAIGDMLYTDQVVPSTEPSKQVTIGNGYMATIINAENFYVNGVYNGYLDVSPSHGAKIPNPMRISVKNTILQGSAIDFQYGLFYRLQSFSGCIIEQTIYAHRELQHLYVHSFNFTGGVKDQTIQVEQVYDPTTSTDVSMQQKIIQNQGIWEGNTLTGETINTSVVSFKIIFDLLPTSFVCQANKTAIYNYFMHVSTSIDTDSQIQTLQDLGEDMYLESHKKAWGQLWKGGVQFFGKDIFVGLTVNSTLYYIYSSMREDSYWAPSPAALASDSFSRHVLWDSQTWILPTVMLFNPKLAKAALQYRISKIEGYISKAISYKLGYEGCMVSWESAVTGEQTASDNLGYYSQHVSSDVILAIKQYYYLSYDTEFLKQAWPLIKCIADFWISRVDPEVNSSVTEYHISGVTPPDTNAFNVTDSIYTNVAASLALFFAYEASVAIQESPNDDWLEVANKIVINYNSTGNMHPEYEGYNGEKIKKADAILINYPLQYNKLNDTQIKGDLDYYKPLTDEGGPNQSWAMYTIGYLQLKDLTSAEPLFTKSYLHYLKGPWNVWQETNTGGAMNYITGGGGFLQSVLNGYGGIRVISDRIQFSVQLLPDSTSWKMRGIEYRGNRFDVMVTAADNATVTCSDGTISVCQLGTGCEYLSTGKSVSVTGSFYVEDQQLR